jgi:hypothetical protein
VECYGPVPTLAAATTILSAIGAVIAVICFGIAMLLLRQMFFLEDLITEHGQGTHLRLTMLTDIQRGLVRDLHPGGKRPSSSR